MRGQPCPAACLLRKDFLLWSPTEEMRDPYLSDVGILPSIKNLHEFSERNPLTIMNFDY